jgi:pimeloyl-ACP methyl ester carboxylesterase
MYQAKRPSRSEFVRIRQLNYHVRTWGQPTPGVAPLVMVHGWMDVGASYQFVVDAFEEAFMQDRFIVAPDWRGFGLSGWENNSYPGHDNYWFPDYMADLDFLIDHTLARYSEAPTQLDLVGHSMGGNVVMLYAGSRPERIRRLINLEGFGMPATKPTQAPKRYAQWMDELKDLYKGDKALKTYPGLEGVAQRLMKTNPRLPLDKALWLASHWSAEVSPGQWQILGDAAHKITNAQLYRVEEVLALYANISAPVLSVEASENQMDVWWKGRFTLAEFHERLKSLPQLKQALVTEAGHMLHHDQPAQLARLIEDFLA